MTPGTGTPQPVLVYGRIAHNRRRTALLVAFTVASLLPFVLGISYFVSAGIVWRVRSESRQTSARLRADRSYLKRLEKANVGSEYRAWVERDMATEEEALARSQSADLDMTVKLMPVIGVALVASLAILFWGIASSPTSKLLGQAGAQPATDSEHEAKRLLENLAIGAGLPPPKLYVIETSVPNAFAAGPDPQHAVVAVTRGALTLLDKRELEGVLAHEISHIGNHDIRLNTIVASIALFLRIPYLMFRRELKSARTSRYGTQRGLGFWELCLSPIGIYILFVAPILGSLLRAAVSREREFLADADAALLTRFPEGLMRALAKIGGAGSTVNGANPAFSHFYFSDPVTSGSWFSGNLLATHPPIAERIERLVQFQGAAGMASLQEAVNQGKQYGKRYPTVTLDASLTAVGHDELSVLNQGNLMGRVYRCLSDKAVPVYDTPNTHSPTLAWVKPGSLLVVYDDPGKMRQINTADQTFGYIDLKVKLKPVDHLIPQEVYDPKLRAAAEAALPPLEMADLPGASSAKSGLTRPQIFIALGFGGAVFAGVFVLLLVLGK